jgi:DUF4097 and DUF4098 domain-containing protein YvlB
MQKSIIYIALLIVSTVVFSSCSLFSQRYEKIEKGEYKISAAGKKKFTLNNVNGKIRIIRTTDSTSIIVKYEKSAYVKKKDLNNPMRDITLTLDTMGTDVKIDTEFETIRPGIHLEIYDDNKVDYEIYVPENIVVNLDNTNGSINASEINNDMRLSTVNGTIKVKNVSGKIDLETTNGDIKAVIDSTKGIKVTTVNGDVNFDFGSKVSATVKADVVYGDVKVDGLDFKLDRKDKKFFQGTLGTGEANVSIETTHGSIRLKGSSTKTEI